MNEAAVIAALRQALAADPRNGPLWLHLSDQLRGAGDAAGALDALRTAAQISAVADDAERRMIPLLRETGQLAEALIRVETLLEASEDPVLRLELARVLEDRGDVPGGATQRRRLAEEHPDFVVDVPPPAHEASAPAQDAPPPAPSPSNAEDTEHPDPALAPVGGDAQDDSWAEQFEWGDLHITFKDVAGLDDVKKQIRLRIIAPFSNPEVYQAFGREGGGGLLLYGPPGCGKTFIARATAGELKARFVSVSIHEIVDKYWGESEKVVHALFEDARRNSPTVLFFDEFDALGASRGRGDSTFWRTLVDQLLQEMDGIDGRNRDVLLFAATNMPWNVDPAFRRPGRFDRVLFVTPPDAAARKQILESRMEKLPGGSNLDVSSVVKRTALMTGADLGHLAERSAEAALERSLDTGDIHDVTQEQVEQALAATQSTALEWFATARNYAKYSNEGGQYDELVKYLKAVKKW